jgi:hypothetical protein
VGVGDEDGAGVGVGVARAADDGPAGCARARFGLTHAAVARSSTASESRATWAAPVVGGELPRRERGGGMDIA